MGFFDFLRPRASRPPGIVLALGGGGARGLAHVGVLEVIEERGISVAGIAGTSAGAVIGAMWLALGSAEAMLARWREFLDSDFPNHLPDVRLTGEVSTRDNLLLHFARRIRQGAAVILALERRALVERADLDRAVAFLIPDVACEDLRIPFAAVATEFGSGQPVALRRGRLRAVVAASSAVPGVVAPYELDGHAYFDGGVVADVPVDQARALLRRPVVAIDVGENAATEQPDFLTVPRALLRAGIFTHDALRRLQLRGADLVLRPNVRHLHWSEFTTFEQAVAAGRAEAERTIRRIEALALRRGQFESASAALAPEKAASRR